MRSWALGSLGEGLRGPGAGASLLVGGSLSQCLAAGPHGVLSLVPVHWWVVLGSSVPGHRVMGVHDWYQHTGRWSQVLGQLRGSGGLMATGLLLCGAVSLPSVSMSSLPGANELEVGLQNSTF